MWPTKNKVDNGPNNSTGANYYQLKRTAENRNKWRGLIVSQPRTRDDTSVR